jgi:hypothetical protein
MVEALNEIARRSSDPPQRRIYHLDDKPEYQLKARFNIFIGKINLRIYYFRKYNRQVNTTQRKVGLGEITWRVSKKSDEFSVAITTVALW